MATATIKLANTIHWDPAAPDKVYLDDVHVGVHNFPFDTRQVSLRFNGGPAMDLSIVDMDRIAVEYLKLRGVKLPAKVNGLVNVAPRPKCDFVVPSRLVDKLSKGKSPEVGPRPGKAAARKPRRRGKS